MDRMNVGERARFRQVLLIAEIMISSPSSMTRRHWHRAGHSRLVTEPIPLRRAGTARLFGRVGQSPTLNTR
jgi:hypothetical protein